MKYAVAFVAGAASVAGVLLWLAVSAT